MHNISRKVGKGIALGSLLVSQLAQSATLPALPEAIPTPQGANISKGISLGQATFSAFDGAKRASDSDGSALGTWQVPVAGLSTRPFNIGKALVRLIDDNGTGNPQCGFNSPRLERIGTNVFLRFEASSRFFETYQWAHNGASIGGGGDRLVLLTVVTPKER